MKQSTGRSPIPLGEVLASIRARIESQLPKSGFAKSGFAPPQSNSLPVARGAVTLERWCDAHELLKYEDEEFINEAFHRLFGREPDTEGYQYFLRSIRTRTLSKSEVLQQLSESEEGRLNNVRLLGLTANPVDPMGAGIGDDAAFIRALCRKYLAKDPDAASVQRWTTLLERRMITREDITVLFSRRRSNRSLAALPSDVQQMRSLLSGMRQQLSYHQRILENLLSRNV